MKVTIRDSHVEEKTWQKGDRSGVIRTQEAIFETDNIKGRGRIDLGKDQPAYPVGEYTCNLDDNFVLNNFGDPGLSRRLKLVPVAQPMAARKVA